LIAGKSLLPSQTKRGPKGVLLVLARSICPALPLVIKSRPLIDRAVAIDAGDRGRVGAVRHKACRCHEHRRRNGNRRTACRARDAHLFKCTAFVKLSSNRSLSILLSSRSSRLPFRSCFENRAGRPQAVSVIIGELGVLKLRIQFPRLGREKLCRPKVPRAAAASGFSIVDLTSSVSRRIVLFLRIHPNSPSVPSLVPTRCNRDTGSRRDFPDAYGSSCTGSTESTA